MSKFIKVIVHYPMGKHSEYMKLFNTLNDKKFISIGSIVMMKGDDFWHDFKMKIKDFLEFYTHFETVANKYIVYAI
jgi:hypothetical protein